MAEDSKIRYDELFDDNLVERLKDTKTALNGVKDAVKKMQDEVKGYAAEVNTQTAANVSSVEAIARLEARMASLYDLYSKLCGVSKMVAADMGNVDKAIRTATGSSSDALKDLREELSRFGKQGFDMFNMRASIPWTGSLKDLERALKEIDAAMKQLGESERAVAVQDNLLKDTIDALKAKINEAKGEVNDISKTMQKFKNLSAAEAKAVNAIVEEFDRMRTEVRDGNSEALHQIDLTKTLNGSYNQIAATYAMLKERMKSMNMEAGDSSDVFDSVTNSLLELHNKMNAIQEATGVFTLNVGNYQKAFAGLQFSTQQVLREIPSARDLQQFFLAISNNLPILADYMVKYRRSIKNVNADIKALQKQLDELHRQQAIVEEGGSAWQAYEDKIKETREALEKLEKMPKNSWTGVLKSMFSWQTAIIAGIIVLTKYGAQIWDWIKRTLKGVKEISHEIDKSVATARLMEQVASKTMDDVAELELVVNQLKNVQKGTKEWSDGIARVNEITHQNNNALDVTQGKLEKITDEYKQQAIQIATNQAVVSMMAESQQNQMKRDMLLSGQAWKQKSFDEIVSILGIGEDSKEYNNLKKEYDLWNKAASRNRFGLRSEFGTSNAFENAIRENTKVLDASSSDYLTSQYKAMKQKITQGSTRSRKAPSYQQWEELYWQSEEAKLKTLVEGYGKEVEIQNLAYAKEQEEIEKSLDVQLEKLEENIANKLMTREQADEVTLTLAKQRDAMLEGLEAEHNKKLKEIKDKYDAEAVAKYMESTKAELVQIRKRVRNRTDEYNRNKDIVHNMTALEEQLAKWEAISAEEGTKAWEERKKGIDETRGSIAKLQAQLDVSKTLNVSRDIWEVIGMTKWQHSRTADNIKEVLKSAGVDSSTLEKATEEQLEGWFDTLVEKLEDSLENAWGITTGYVNDMIASWVSLADAKRDAAQAGVDAAKEAYENEKSLMDAGLANAIDVAWEEYQQKKKIQEQAAKDAAKAAKVQQALNAATSATELVKASAEIWAASAKTGIFSPAVATGLISAMWASFLGAQSMAWSVSSKQYGEGTAQLIDYGGSHASGNDVPLGVDKYGHPERIERGEIKAVIKKSSVGRYGAGRLIGLINAINDGSYVDGALSTMQRNMSLNISGVSSDVNLSKIEQTLVAIRDNGEEKTYVADGWLIVKKGNRTRRVKL